MRNGELLAVMLIAVNFLCLPAVTTVNRLVNPLRDQIVTGKDGQTVLSLRHRKVMFHDDWLPLMFGAAAIHFITAVMVLRLPTGLVEGLRALQVLATISPTVCGLCYLLLGLRDGLFMADILRQEAAKEKSINQE